MIQKDLGPVSAYALAVEQGYEGTEEEWATVQMNCARNAELAAEAKAGAELAKTGAETAKTAAQTAKTQAETARTEAQAARTGAEEAKEGAEEARDETLEALSRLPSTEEDKEWILGRGETHESTHLTTVGHAKDIYDDLNTRKADNGGVLRGVTADLANNLTDPDAQSMTEQFFIQNVNSGNTENGKSVLQIESIQGNSVILHQLVGRTLQTANGQITSTDYDNGDMLQYTFTVAEAQPGCKVYDAGITIPEGHKVYVEFKLNPYLIQTSASVFCGNVVSTPVSCTKKKKQPDRSGSDS